MSHRLPPMIYPTTVITLVFTMLVIISGCGKGIEDTGARLARVNGEIVELSGEEEESVCADQYCEPNYIYSIHFGSSRKKPARKPKPKLPAERVDYSKEILNVAEAWAETKGSREVVVAVIDTGVELTHPDLKKNLWVNWAEYFGRSGVDSDGNGYVDDVYGYDFYHDRPNGNDDNRHGTHCAGIVAAEENGVGTIGVAPRVRIMPIKFLGPYGSGSTYSAVRAIRYAIDNGADVISLSWGGGGYSEFLNEAIQEAISRGIAVVAAAGNNASNNDWSPTFPASYAGVISVGSTDSQDRLSSFSNFGHRSVTVAAPGSDIYSAVIGSGWANLSGTSMATPQVAGAIALAKSVNPEIPLSGIREALCETSKKIHLGQVKCGRLDVGAFVTRVASAGEGEGE